MKGGREAEADMAIEAGLNITFYLSKIYKFIKAEKIFFYFLLLRKR